MQDGHGIAEAHYKLHVVLNDQKGNSSLIEIADAILQVMNHGRIDAASGLIQQDHLRLGNKDECELKQLLLPIGEVAAYFPSQ